LPSLEQIWQEQGWKKGRNKQSLDERIGDDPNPTVQEPLSNQEKTERQRFAGAAWSGRQEPQIHERARWDDGSFEMAHHLGTRVGFQQAQMQQWASKPASVAGTAPIYTPYISNYWLFWLSIYMTKWMYPEK
jgi:hypothetical protein